MCTVTFIARNHGYTLGMNRDEKLTRTKGLPPKLRTLNGVKVLYPSEPGGGTWIALNEAGVTLALINWYSVTRKVEQDSVSRGEIVRILSGCSSANLVDTGLRTLPLPSINPFRLIGVFPVKEVVEWRWNLGRLAKTSHRWKTQQWISSGFDELTAQRVRDGEFRRALRYTSASRLSWLRRLHGSHAPHVGPFSTCMHRSDAATVSYTEIIVSSLTAKMRYHVGALCKRPINLREAPSLRLSQSHAKRSHEV